jgi:hypothetical protein
MTNSIPDSNRPGRTPRKRVSGRSSAPSAPEPPEILLARELGRLIGKHLAEKWQAPSSHTPNQTGQPQPPQAKI